MTPRELYLACQDIVDKTRVNKLILGQLLYDLKRNDTFKLAVGALETWEEFLSQPEISMKVNEVNKLIDTYRYMKKYNIPSEKIRGIPVQSINFLIRKIKSNTLTDDEVRALIDDANVLSFKDLKEKYIEIKGLTKTYEYVVMKRCKETNNLTKIHDVDSETIKEKLKLND
jgi:hypothetical protein